MLILTRQKEQEIQIGDDITIKVLRIQDGRVQLGITAPRDVHVDRKEVAQRKEEANGRPTPA